MKHPLLFLTLMLAIAAVGCNSSKRKAGDNVVANVTLLASLRPFVVATLTCATY